MDKFVQIFKQVAEDSRYEERVLTEEFKREMSGVIRYKLIKAEYLSQGIK